MRHDLYPVKCDDSGHYITNGSEQPQVHISAKDCGHEWSTQQDGCSWKSTQVEQHIKLANGKISVLLKELAFSVTT